MMSSVEDKTRSLDTYQVSHKVAALGIAAGAVVGGVVILNLACPLDKFGFAIGWGAGTVRCVVIGVVAILLMRYLRPPKWNWILTSVLSLVTSVLALMTAEMCVWLMRVFVLRS
jgi:hypothetical protein